MEDKKEIVDNGKKEIQVIITMKESGEISVEGIIANEPLAFWMLDKAKDIIKLYNIKQAQKQQIIQPKGGIMNFVRGRL